MASKALVLFGLFAVLLVVSEVAAATERQSGTVKSEETVQPDQYGGGNKVYGGGGDIKRGGPCYYGCCYKRYISGCSRCCSYAGEAVQTQPGH